jgi:malic enzyme
LQIATAVAEKAYELGIAQIKKPQDMKKFISDKIFDPRY